MVETLIHYNLFLLILLSIFKDFIFFKIDNEYCLLIFFLYLLHFALHLSLGIGFHALAMGALTLFIGFVLTLFHLIGAGDVKFLSALILWIPHGWGVDFIFIITLLGGLLSFTEYYLQKPFQTLRTYTASFLKKRHLYAHETYKPPAGKKSFLRMPVPYGVAIGISALIFINI